MSPICESFRNVPPSESIRKILILRTAPMAQVHGAVEHLRGLYPDAQFAVLGTFLGDGFFDGMQKFEVHDRWVTPRSCAPLRRRVEQERFDIAVLCLNSEHVVGYDRVSKVLQWISADLKLVAGYTGIWHLWQYGDFVEGDRKSTRLNSSHIQKSRMPSSA